MSRFAYESGHSVRTQAYVFVVSFVLGLLIARHLGPAPRGVLLLAQQVFTLCTMLGGLGFHAGVRYWIARDPSGVAETLSRGAALAGVSMATALGLYVATYLGLGGGYLASVPRDVVLLFGALVPLNVLNAYVTAVVYGDGDVVGVNTVNVTALTFRAALVVTFLLMGLTIERVVLAAIGMESATLILLWRRASARLGGLISRPRTSGAGPMARYGLTSMASNVLQFLNYRADVFLLAALRTDTEVGKYGVAVTLAEILMRASAALSRPLFPRVARESLPATATARASRMAVIALSLLTVALLGPALLAHVYLGEAYAGMFTAFLWLLPGTVAYGLGYLIQFDLQARGAVGQLALASATSFLLNVALNLLLIPRYGINGAAWATSAAYALNLLINGLLFSRMHGIGLTALWVPGRADIGELRHRARAFLGGLSAR